MRKQFKLLIISDSCRAGKDTAAEFLRDNYGMTFYSSSHFAAQKFIFEALKEKYNYKSIEECFEDRVNHRQEWYEMICEYNSEDPLRLAKEMLETSECYVGMRSLREQKAAWDTNTFDIILWIDASERLGEEASTSNTLDKRYSHIQIDNNTNLEDFYNRLHAFGKMYEMQN